MEDIYIKKMEEKKKSIASFSKDLDDLNNILFKLSMEDDVKNYKRLLESDSVKSYNDCLAKINRIREYLTGEKLQLRDYEQRVCNHEVLLQISDEMKGNTIKCRCLDCDLESNYLIKKQRIIYFGKSLNKDDINYISSSYKELINEDVNKLIACDVIENDYKDRKGGRKR